VSKNSKLTNENVPLLSISAFIHSPVKGENIENGATLVQDDDWKDIYSFMKQTEATFLEY
jgi:hypothetical protein